MIQLKLGDQDATTARTKLLKFHFSGLFHLTSCTHKAKEPERGINFSRSPFFIWTTYLLRSSQMHTPVKKH